MWNESGIQTFMAGEALAARRLVKIDASTTEDPPEVIYADAGEDAIGITEYAVDSGDCVAVKLLNSTGTFEVEVDGTVTRGEQLYAANDGKASDTSSGSALGVALETGVSGALIEMAFDYRKPTTAAGTTIADAGTFTATATVEAALQEIYQHIITAQALAAVNLLGATEIDGTILAAFADGASTTPGIDAQASEAIGIRWNNHANPDPIITSVVIPPDLDASADVVVHVLAAKTGATAGDATTFDVGAFFLTDAALYDADADAGGTTGAMTGDAAAKTLQEVTVTIGAADVAGAPGVLSLTLQPTDGTLGTDDVIVVGLWLEYTRQALTS